MCLDGVIRTPVLLNPNQADYQAFLHPGMLLNCQVEAGAGIEPAYSAYEAGPEPPPVYPAI